MSVLGVWASLGISSKIMMLASVARVETAALQRDRQGSRERPKTHWVCSNKGHRDECKEVQEEARNLLQAVEDGTKLHSRRRKAIDVGASVKCKWAPRSCTRQYIYHWYMFIINSTFQIHNGTRNFYFFTCYSVDFPVSS